MTFFKIVGYNKKGNDEILMLKNIQLLFSPATLSEEWLRDLYFIFYNPLCTTSLKIAMLL